MNKNNQIVLIIVVLAVVFLSFPTFFFVRSNPSNLNEKASAIEAGSENCDASLGIEWNDDLQVCIKTSAMYSNEDKEAIKTVTQFIGSVPGLISSGVRKLNDGGLLVLLERANIKVGLLVQDGQVKDRPFSGLECVNRGGRVSQANSGSVCNPDEYLTGLIENSEPAEYCCYSDALNQ
jgi:hypothetical protein